MPSFKEFLFEGNPLAQMHKHALDGRHFIAMSAKRPDQSPSETKKKMKELEHHFSKHGYSFRRSEGHYEGGKEPSLVVHAKAPGKHEGAKLVAHARAAGEHFNQDSVLHHNGKTARLIGTNETGFPGKGKSEKVGGRLKMNNKESPFQTEFRSKPDDAKRMEIHKKKGRVDKANARFTT